MTMERPTAEELRELYLVQRKTTREIGTRYGVRHTSVRRWLKHHGIETRPAGRGLANRGTAAPAAEELHRLVHVEHLSYRDIGDRYGVDHTAVPVWLDQYGIAKPGVWDTRRRGAVVALPSAVDLRRRYEAGESLRTLIRGTGVSESTLADVMRSAGIEIRDNGWNGGRRFACTDGHPARSVYEQRVDDWLAAHGYAHEIEPRLPFDRRCRADFLVGSLYIEVWGVTNLPSYTARRQRKTRLYAQHGLPLIGLPVHAFGRGTWARRLADGLTAAGATR